jgi:hypothetical protein
VIVEKTQGMDCPGVAQFLLIHCYKQTTWEYSRVGFILNRVEFSIILVKYFTRRKEDSKSSGKNVIVLRAIKHESIRG